jgi:hypothetical protein
MQPVAWFDRQHAAATTWNAATDASRNARSTASRRGDDATSCPWRNASRWSTASSWWSAATDAGRDDASFSTDVGCSAAAFAHESAAGAAEPQNQWAGHAGSELTWLAGDEERAESRW